MKKVLVLSALILGGFFSVTAQEDTALATYTGTYTFKEGSPTPSIEITIQNGTLYGNSSLGSGSFARVSRDTFNIPEHNGAAYFGRNEGGKVKSIRIVVGDLVLEGDKPVAGIALLQRQRFYAAVRK